VLGVFVSTGAIIVSLTTAALVLLELFVLQAPTTIAINKKISNRLYIINVLG
jgi:hypothetical protein